jgi:hypothetical protein
MELLVYSTLNDEKSVLFEVAKIKTGLVFTDWVWSVGYSFQMMNFLHLNDQATPKIIIHNYNNISARVTGMHSKDSIDSFYKSYLVLKNKKYKTKDDLIELGKKESTVKSLKKDLITVTKQYFELINASELLPFMENNIFKIDTIALGRRTDSFIMNLREYSINYCLDGTVFRDGDSLIDSENSSFQQRKDLSFINIPLFQLPDLNSMNYAQLRIIRNEFLEKFEPFYKPYCDLQKELFEILYEESNFENIHHKIDEVFNPYLPVFKEATENNIYFSMIKNSIPDVPVYQFSAVVTSLKNLIELFVKDNIITHDEREIIIEGVGRTKDINSTVAFFYLDKVSKTL